MYPRYLKGLVYGEENSPVDNRQIRAMLQGKKPGSFAFYQINTRRLEFSPKAKATTTPGIRKAGTIQTGKKRSLADAYKIGKDPSQVGVAYVKPDGLVGNIKINCRSVSLRFESLNAFIEDMKLRGVLLRKDKMLVPELNYMPLLATREP